MISSITRALALMMAARKPWRLARGISWRYDRRLWWRGGDMALLAAETSATRLWRASRQAA